MITAIVQSYRRQDNIPVIIECLRKQTIKPERIIVWNDNDGSGRDLYNLGKDVEVINTNSNYNGNYGAFLAAYLADSKYIAVIDDDCPPAKKWFEFCINNQKNKVVFSEFGIILMSNKYRGRKAVVTKVGAQKKFRSVDMVGHTYFFPKQAVLPMFSMRPPAWHNNCDLHFSFLARQYGWRLLIPTVTDKDQLPISSDIKLPFSSRENSMFHTPNHILNRNSYVAWAIKNKLIERKV